MNAWATISRRILGMRVGITQRIGGQSAASRQIAALQDHNEALVDMLEHVLAHRHELTFGEVEQAKRVLARKGRRS